MFTYRLFCDDTTIVITGNKPLNLDQVVLDALNSLNDEELLEPADDWFYTVLGRICEMTGFCYAAPTGECDLEKFYLNACVKRTKT